MKRFLISVCSLLFVVCSYAQTPKPGYQYDSRKLQIMRQIVDSTQHMPAGGAVPSLRGGWTGAGAQYWDSVGKKLRIWDGSYFRNYPDSIYSINDSALVIRYGTRKDTISSKVAGMSVGASINGSAIGITGSPVTGIGTLAFSWAGSSSQYVKGNGALGTFSSDVQGVGDARYSLLGHTHIAANITDFTAAVRGSVGASGTLSYNSTTGIFSFIGSGGIQSLGNGYGLNIINDSTYNVDTSLIATVYDNSLKLNISDTASMLSVYLRKSDTTNKWVQDSYVRSDSLFKYKNGTETFLQRFYPYNSNPLGYLVAADISGKLNSSDTANHWVNSISRTPGKDSIIFYIGATRYAIKDSVGGGSTPGIDDVLAVAQNLTANRSINTTGSYEFVIGNATKFRVDLTSNGTDAGWDIPTKDSTTGYWKRIPKGTVNQVLTMLPAGGIGWANATGGISSLTSVGGGLDIQTGGAGNIRTLNSNFFSVGSDLISIDTSTGPTKIATQYDVANAVAVGAFRVGVINSLTKSANGAVIQGDSIVLQEADATNNGLISTGPQSIAGNKTFTGSTLNLTGSLGIIGSTLFKFRQKLSSIGTPPSGEAVLAVKTDDSLYFRTDAGVEINLSRAGSGGGGGTLNLSYDAANHEIDISGGGTSAVIPLATASDNGLVSTTTQTFAGNKTLTGFTSFTGGFATTSYSTITSGSSSTVGNAITTVLFDPASDLGTYTLTMPASPTDGQWIYISFGGTVTAGNAVASTFSLSPNAGQSIYSAITPTQGYGGDQMAFQYKTSNTTWYRKM